MSASGLFILLSFLFSSLIFAKKWAEMTKGTWILVWFIQVLTSVEALGMLNALNERNLLWLSTGWLLLGVFWMKGLKKQKIFDVPFFVGAAMLGSIVFYLNLQIPLAETDSIGYHLPIVSQLLRTEGVWEVFQAGFVGPNTYFPANHEALQAFLVLLTGSYHFNFLVTFLAFCLFYQSLRGIYPQKVGRLVIFILLAATVSTPFLFQQFFNVQVDLFLFCLCGSALAFLIAAVVQKNKTELLKCFLVFGLALGTKYNALLQGVLFLPLLGCAAFVFRKEWKKIVWYPLAAAFTGGFWYLRNFFLTDNPLYPFGLNIGPLHFVGHKKFLEDMEGTSIMDAAGQSSWGEVFHSIVSHPDFHELGALALVLPLVAVLAGAIQKKSALGYFLLVTFLLEIYAYFTSPYTFTLWNETIRYSSVCFAIALVLLVLLVSRTKFLAFGLSILGVGIIAYTLFFNSIFSENSYKALFRGELDAHGFTAQELNGYGALLPHLERLRLETPRENNKIALAGPTFYFLFEKEGFQPFYMNIDGCGECTYPDYRELEGSVRAKPNEDAWKNLLKKAQMNYLLVGSTNYHSADVVLVEKEWAEADSVLFTKLLETNGLTLYKIN